jgi:imidazoleglycerol phosphate synthase glutamine amidotransferase subunit HisH
MKVFFPRTDEEKTHACLTSHYDVKKEHQVYEKFVLSKIFYYIHSFYLYSIEQSKLFFNNTNLYIHITI